jgi:hypothetical protein
MRTFKYQWKASGWNVITLSKTSQLKFQSAEHRRDGWQILSEVVHTFMPDQFSCSDAVTSLDTGLRPLLDACMAWCRHATLIEGPGGAERTTSLEEEGVAAEAGGAEGEEVTAKGSAHAMATCSAVVAVTALLALL